MNNKEPRLRFTEEERADPALEKPIHKAEKAAAKADKAQAKIPKKKVKQTAVDPDTGKVTTKLVLEDKKKPPSKLSHSVRDAPGNAALGKIHKEIRETEQDNVGVESAHKSEEAAETGVHLVREGYRSHKLKPYRKAAQAEKKLEKANVNALYQKSLRENPQLASNPFSRWQQKQAIKKEYAAAKRAGQTAGSTAKTASKTGKAAKTVKEKAQQAGAFVMRHKKGAGIVLALFLVVCLLMNTISSCSMLGQGIGSVVTGSTYPSDDPELVAVEADYAAKEADLQAEIDNIENSHPGYDEYRYDLDMIGHDPHELAAYLSAVLQGYTRQSAQAELERVFDAQYQLTLTEEVEVRYRTETRTDSEGNSYTVEVPYNYYILNVTLTSKPISSVASELLTPDQLEMYQVYRATLGNKPLIFGGGSPDMGNSEDLTGVEFVNGSRPGNQAVVDLAKGQVGNVGGQPYWSWYGFTSRVEWCACFVSWCYGQMGLSEPRFAACQSQGVPWFQSHGQWGARGYADIAPGDAIFFDWDLDGSADHVGIVVGTDGSRVYTVEGNSGDACKIKSYDLNYECIKGYGTFEYNGRREDDYIVPFTENEFSYLSKYIMGLIGPNGSGKTTTIKLILNMLKRNGGEIKIMGLDNIADEQKAKSELGVVFDTNYFSDDWQVTQVEKSISVFYPNWKSERFAEMLRKFHIAPSKKVKELSKGMQMKLMLACAFSYDAKLLILDEPTSGLDPVSRDELLQILSEYIEDGEHSVLFSTHITGDLERAADYITYISYGELFFSGSKDEFVDMFRIVKGGTEELSADLKEKAVGVRTFPTGFEALVKTEDTGAFSSLSIEPATIDEIVVFTSKKGDDYE